MRRILPAGARASTFEE